MTVESPEPIDVMKRRFGSKSRAFLDRLKAQTRLKNRIRRALRAGPRSVGDLATELDADARDVLWQLMAMRKYGKVVDAGDVDGCRTYAAVEEGR